jgi:hypothetical protein
MSAAPSGRPAISGSTALVGVLGDPVRHSLSPAMHNAALRQLGLDWVYLALPTPAASLAPVLEGLEALGCRGLNVTIPHKQAVAALCRELSPLAQRLGAVNTLVPHRQGGWFGTNTDVEGFLAPLREPAHPGAAGASWAEQRALVLGCGGSARAVVAALVELGLGRITLAGLDLDQSRLQPDPQPGQGRAKIMGNSVAGMPQPAHGALEAVQHVIQSLGQFVILVTNAAHPGSGLEVAAPHRCDGFSQTLHMSGDIPAHQGAA